MIKAEEPITNPSEEVEALKVVLRDDGLNSAAMYEGDKRAAMVTLARITKLHTARLAVCDAAIECETTLVRDLDAASSSSVDAKPYMTARYNLGKAVKVLLAKERGSK